MATDQQRDQHTARKQVIEGIAGKVIDLAVSDGRSYVRLHTPDGCYDVRIAPDLTLAITYSSLRGEIRP